jgi:hypothetical protein
MKTVSKLFGCVLLMTFPLMVDGQSPETDIYLVEVNLKNNRKSFGKPVKITQNPGYDNQPMFFTNDRMLYVSMQDSIQTDIYEYSITSKQSKLLAGTLESEYSPTLLPNQSAFSTVRVDNDKGQRLYRFESIPTQAELITPGIDSVAYHCWMNDTLVAIVILSKINMDLILYDINSQQYVVAANDVRRCVLKDPISGKLIFTMPSGDNIMFLQLDYEKFESDVVFEGIPGVEDYTFTPDGELYAGFKGKLYGFKPHGDRTWHEVADFSSSIGEFYRIAVSPNGRYLALVSYKGQRP